MAWYDDYQGRYYHRRDRLHTPTVNVFSGCGLCGTHGSLTPTIPYAIDEPDPALGAAVLARTRRQLLGWSGFGRYSGFGASADDAAGAIAGAICSVVSFPSCAGVVKTLLELGASKLLNEVFSVVVKGKGAFSTWYYYNIATPLGDNLLFKAAGYDRTKIVNETVTPVWDALVKLALASGVSLPWVTTPAQTPAPTPAPVVPFNPATLATLQYLTSQQVFPMQVGVLTPPGVTPPGGTPPATTSTAKAVVPLVAAGVLAFLLLR